MLPEFGPFWKVPGGVVFGLDGTGMLSLHQKFG